MSDGNPLQWTIGENRINSLEVGYVVSPSKIRIRLFTIDHSIQRGARPYVLRSTLPGYSQGRPVDSIEDGKQMAEKILQRFRTILDYEESDLDEAIERAVEP